MTREQRLQLAQYCRLDQSYQGNEYIFHPIGSSATIGISRVDTNEVSGYPNGIVTSQGHYRSINCQSHALPPDIEDAIDKLLIERAEQIQNKMGADHSHIRDILKEVRYV